MESVLRETATERLKREAVQKRSGRTRRNLLKGFGALVAAEAADMLTGGHLTKAIIASSKETPTAKKTTLEKLLDNGVKPTRAYIGDIKIIKSLPNYGMLQVHDGPYLTSQPTRIFDWENIETWNGFNVRNVNEFTVKNALFLDAGDNADSPKETKRINGEWMVGTVGTDTFGFKDEQPDYVSYGSTTNRLVIPISGQFRNITITDKGVMVEGIKDPMPLSDFGQVTPPKTA